MTTIIFIGFCFSASCAESSTKRTFNLEVHPSIVRYNQIFLDKLKTWLHGKSQLLNLVSFVHCLWPQIFNFGFAFPPVLLNHQEINHPRSASKNIAIQPNFLRQVKDLITRKNPTPQSCVLCVGAWLHKETGRLNFTFVKEKCVTQGRDKPILALPGLRKQPKWDIEWNVYYKRGT